MGRALLVRLARRGTGATANHMRRATRAARAGYCWDLGFGIWDSRDSRDSNRNAESPIPNPESRLFVAERLDRIEARCFEGGIHSEEDADRGRESEDGCE